MNISKSHHDDSDADEQRRLQALPFKMTIHEVFALQKRNAIVVAGIIESGTLRKGDEIVILGRDRQIQSKVAGFAVFVRDENSFVAEAGNNIHISLTDVNREDIEIGMVISAK